MLLYKLLGFCEIAREFTTPCRTRNINNIVQLKRIVGKLCQAIQYGEICYYYYLYVQYDNKILHVYIYISIYMYN